MEAHDEPAKKLEQNPFPAKELKLNVGGNIFSTSLATLRNAPSGSMLEAMFSVRFDTKPSEDGSYFIDRDGTHFRAQDNNNWLRNNYGMLTFWWSIKVFKTRERCCAWWTSSLAGSMLEAMFSGRFDTRPSEDGSYFIDRDGTHFRYILNYLRTGQLIVPKDETTRQELLAEAEFYQVGGIVNELTARPFQDSVILSWEQCRILMNWLKETGAMADFTMASGNLLYRASRDGWAASNFHSCCDKKGPTVTVVKSGNYIFGGYTGHEWKGSGDWTNAPGSFLFSLVNPKGLSPTQMPLKPGQEEYAIYCRSDYGPIFGRGHDLVVVNEPHSKYCWALLNNSYQCPFSQTGSTFLTGNENFTVSELEVFVIEK